MIDLKLRTREELMKYAEELDIDTDSAFGPNTPRDFIEEVILSCRSTVLSEKKVSKKHTPEETMVSIDPASIIAERDALRTANEELVGVLRGCHQVFDDIAEMGGVDGYILACSQEKIKATLSRHAKQKGTT